MNKALDELMWAAHRAEGEAAHAIDNTEGMFIDIRDEQQLPVEGDIEGIHTFNLGVSMGIKTFLDHLSTAGYSIVTPDGDVIAPHSEGCKTEPLGETWQHWLLSGGKNLRVAE
ncbi:hypothetical protein PA10_00248 [Pseudomonas phage pPa_SNUABM_DT01]|nr:hypothetical protein PA10_00248 [Pseudomonas phage pPa_SNUABM_DT01]